VTFAAGLATQGRIPVVAIYSTFLQRAYDQIVHDVCVQNLPVIFALDRAGIVGDDGKTHQGVFDLAYLRILPNMVVMAPRDENDLQHLLCTAVAHAAAGRGPIALRYPRGAGTGTSLDAEPHPLPLGQASLLRDGRDLGILALGPTVGHALGAAELLAEQGISTAVADARFVKPLDEALIIALVERVDALLTVEEHALAGGFGSAVVELLTARGHRGPVIQLAVPDEFVEHGKPGDLRAAIELDGPGIAKRARTALPHLGAAAAGR
jgi:1-deoxy-D-xylulose-5-phosphate synthase